MPSSIDHVMDTYPILPAVGVTNTSNDDQDSFLGQVVEGAHITSNFHTSKVVVTPGLVSESFEELLNLSEIVDWISLEIPSPIQTRYNLVGRSTACDKGECLDAKFKFVASTSTISNDFNQSSFLPVTKDVGLKKDIVSHKQVDDSSERLTKKNVLPLAVRGPSDIVAEKPGSQSSDNDDSKLDQVRKPLISLTSEYKWCYQSWDVEHIN